MTFAYSPPASWDGLTEVRFRDWMTVEYIDHMGSDERVVEAMLVSTDAEAAADDLAKQPGRINFLMRDRHGSPFEHTAFTFLVEAPIFVFREWHRHRIGFSYNELSGRYSVLPATYYVISPDRAAKQVGKPGAYSYVPLDPETQAWLASDMEEEAIDNYARYERRLQRGVAREVARMGLGVNVFTKMFVTLNARSLMAFLSLRTRDDRAKFPSFPQHEINMCASQLEEHFAVEFPLTYDAFNKNGRVAP